MGHTTYQMVAALSPTTEAERAIRNQAMELANTILQTRLILHEQSSTRMPLPFLVVLVFWPRARSSSSSNCTGRSAA